ncbi:TonB family protein [Marinospirillum insulare]|uniref:Protein TonB n=1 Tax=Marinospirillum insulare TaxID=217169 RepID=A0ABQ6A0A8_9GAMM|nr:TonB family protein [Marinospirillum insulare]GLR65231.1 hypothetical protein GCM10007878_26700 [Marinospirillum insulare]
MLSPRLMPLLLFPLALALSLGLFAGLGWIIQGPSGGLSEKTPRLALNWVQVAGDTEVETLKPPPPPPPPPPPETQQQSTSSSANRSDFAVSNASSDISLPLPSIDTGLATNATPSLQNLGIDSSADVPVYREAPRYPRQAMARRQEGWVELVFEVDAEGKVLTDTIRVVDAQPKNLFDRAARRAIARWRFAAYELGAGTNRQLRQRLEFRLEGG